MNIFFCVKVKYVQTLSYNNKSWEHIFLDAVPVK